MAKASLPRHNFYKKIKWWKFCINVGWLCGNSSYEHAWRSDMHQTTFESWLIFDISPYTYWRMGIVIICICISLMFVIMWYLYPSKYSQRFWLFQIWLSLCLFGIRVEGLRNGKVLVVTNVKQVLQFH
jgi:hypothetical protein